MTVTIDAMTFYAYQTGSTTASTITNINWTIYDGDPGAGGSAIASGSGLQTSVWSNIYRVTETTRLVVRLGQLWESTVNTNGIYLPAGTYWVAAKQMGTRLLALGHRQSLSMDRQRLVMGRNLPLPMVYGRQLMILGTNTTARFTVCFGRFSW
ncbi:MAG: hypothetical protein R3E31_07150 [Chloroflexota bacterium]